jgi:hypothetical protein
MAAMAAALRQLFGGAVEQIRKGVPHGAATWSVAGLWSSLPVKEGVAVLSLKSPRDAAN